MGSKVTGRYRPVTFKEELENNLVYVFEESPSTNSLALSKQFKVDSSKVMKIIYSIISNKPSLISGIKLSAYKYIGNNGESFSTYYEISEEVYHEFINKLSTPKSIEMRIYRDAKKKEYFNGFVNLRQDIYSRGALKEEVRETINNKNRKVRVLKTKKLMSMTYDFVKHYNNNVSEDNKIPLPFFNRLIFNIVNAYVGIDARRFSDNNRGNLSDASLELLIDSENELAIALESNKDKLNNNGLKPVLLLSFHKTIFRYCEGLEEVEREIVSMLYDFGSIDLWTRLK